MTDVAATETAISRDVPCLLRKAQDRLTVPPMTAALGVNPCWQKASTEELLVPAYRGVEEVAKIALMFTLWSSAEAFLYGECGVEPVVNAREEKKHQAILHESETSLMCLLCLLNNEPYTASGLVDAMVGRDASLDRRGNARKRLINRTLPVIAEHYGLLQFQEYNRGNQREYRITRSARLATFAEQYLVTGVQQITGSEE